MHKMVIYKVEKCGLSDSTVTWSLLDHPIQEDALVIDGSLEGSTQWLAGARNVLVNIFTNDLGDERQAIF